MLVQLTTLYLVRARAPITLTDLARALGTEQQVASALADRLIHAGLVRRRTNPRHQGHVALALTPTGQAIIGDPSPDTITWLRAVLNDPVCGWAPRRWPPMNAI